MMVAGCGRRSVDLLPPGVADATMASDGSSDSPGESGALGDTEDSTGGSPDAASAGSCGSRISFQVIAAAGVDPGSFCTYGCNTIANITFTSGSTQVTADDIASPNCVSLCDTCGTLAICHSCAGISPFPFAGISYDWDGSYWASGTCGGQPCRGPQVCAPAGHYTGEFCALRGTTVSGRCTPSQGTPSGDVSCSTVELDLPSTETITVELGP